MRAQAQLAAPGAAASPGRDAEMGAGTAPNTLPPANGDAPEDAVWRACGCTVAGMSLLSEGQPGGRGEGGGWEGGVGV